MGSTSLMGRLNFMGLIRHFVLVFPPFDGFVLDIKKIQTSSCLNSLVVS